jgi:amidase
MSVKRPTPNQMMEIVEGLGMSMTAERISEFMGLMEGNFTAYDLIDLLPDYVPQVKYPRTPGYRPQGDENKYNAWYVKTEIKGAPGGQLAGKRVAIKDNVCIAGVPMMNGASTLAGFTPDLDATIVTRLLDAGATIVGKAHCECFCFSGGSHTAAAGSSTHSSPAIRLAARRPAAPPSSRRARLTWRSAAIRAARSASPRRIAAFTA